MDSKLELLLDKINLDTEDYKNFEDGKILKIISSKDKLNWNFILEVKDLLPISSLEKLDEIKEAFPDLKSVTYTLKIEGITNAKVNEYYSYVINSLKLGKGIAMIFLNKEIRFTTNGMVLEASNKAEENVINSKIKARLNKISVLYMLYSNDEDDESTGRLVQIKIEELRSILLGEFKNYISDSKRQAIEKDLSKIAEKVRINSKTKTR